MSTNPPIIGAIFLTTFPITFPNRDPKIEQTNVMTPIIKKVHQISDLPPSLFEVAYKEIPTANASIEVATL